MSQYQTFEQNLIKLSIELKNKLKEFSKYSCTSSSQDFQELTFEGKAFQSILREDYKHYFELLRVLFIRHPESTNEKLESFNNDILNAINQEGFSMFVDSCSEIFSEAYSALDSQIELLEEALREKKHRYVFVPDTNALINNPTLENWYFDNIDEF